VENVAMGDGDVGRFRRRKLVDGAHRLTFLWSLLTKPDADRPSWLSKGTLVLYQVATAADCSFQSRSVAMRKNMAI
jgi:hypothetical protein